MHWKYEPWMELKQLDELINLTDKLDDLSCCILFVLKKAICVSVSEKPQRKNCSSRWTI